jgi:hypothetical protein
MGEFWNAIKNASEIENKRLYEEQERKRISEQNSQLDKIRQEELTKKREEDGKREFEQKFITPFKTKFRPILNDIKSHRPDILNSRKSAIVESQNGLELMWGDKFGKEDLTAGEKRIMTEYKYRYSPSSISAIKIPDEIVYEDYHSIEGRVSYSRVNFGELDVKYLSLSINGSSYEFEDFMNDPRIIIPKLVSSPLGRERRSTYRIGSSYWIDKAYEERQERERNLPADGSYPSS